MNILVKKFRDIKKFPKWIYYLPAYLMRFYCFAFFRKKLVDPFSIIANDPHGKIGAIWHNRLFFLAFAFPRKVSRNCVAVISPSRDGQYLTDFISCLGVGALRGSSCQRGVSAQLGGIRAIEAGKDVIFTPDGPRGPKYKIKAGPVHLAAMTGAEVVPMCINYSRYWSLKSWDGFQIPKPFCKVTVALGEPLMVPKDANAEEKERYRCELERRMLALTVDGEVAP